jgi:4-amino-4-deoxy-L-arabinose transferase-like glycosyltransferase
MRQQDSSHSQEHPTGNSRREEIIALVVLSVAALALRLAGLGSESIWLDEATSIWLAKKSIPDMIRWTAVDIHPPLYYAILHLWLALGDGEAQVRLLSVLCGVLSVAALFLLARRICNPWTAFASAALLAVSPLHVWYSQETRMYAMLAMWAILSTYALLLALLDGRRRAWLAYVVFTILSLYTHYYTFFVLLFQILAGVYLLWQGSIQRQSLWRLLVALTVAGLAFVPWLPTLVNQVQSGGGSWVARTGVPGVGTLAATAANYTLGPDISVYPPLLRRLAYLLYGFACAAGAVSIIHRPARTAAAIGLIWLAAPLGVAWLVSQIKPLYSLRYLLPFLAPYYILIGQGIDILRTGWPPGSVSRGSRTVWAAALACLLMIGLAGVIGSATRQQATDWREISSYIIERSEANDIVLFVPGWNDKPFDYYARGRMALEGDTPIPVPVDGIPSLIEAKTSGHTRVWLVYAEGHYADPQGQVATYLDRTYRRVDGALFRGVSVALFTVKP